MATGGWTHVLTELSPLDALEGPLRRSARLRYTCVSVSKKYIALGSNTGGVYIFSRDTLKHLQVVYGDVESSALSATSVSPNDVFVAYATGMGQVVVMEMNIEKRQKPERVRLTTDHIGNTVTCLHWDGASSKLYCGDNLGKITVCYVPTSKAKTLFIQPSEVILRLDMAVVQLDWWGDKLLVSTWSRSYLLNTNKQQYSQIGKKLRDGEYGACFFLEPSSQYPVIYCSRPGSRVWEVDFDANVLNTHQFKQLLAIPPLPIIKFNNPQVEFSDPDETFKPQSVGFNKLCRLGPYLITWAGRRIYVFDPVRVRIILWNEQPTDVRDMVTNGTEIFIFLEDQSLTRLHLLPVERCLQLLLAKQVWSVAGELLCYLDNFVAVPFIQRHVSLGSLSELVLKLKSDDLSNLADRVQGIIDEMSSLSDSTDGDSVNGDVIDGKPSHLDTAFKLPSGIFLVNNGIKPKHDSELYSNLPISPFDCKDSFNLPAIQGETIQRYNSLDQLDSGSQHSVVQTQDRGIKKSFSTTALDSLSFSKDPVSLQTINSNENSWTETSPQELENSVEVTVKVEEVKDIHGKISSEEELLKSELLVQEFTEVSLDDERFDRDNSDNIMKKQNENHSNTETEDTNTSLEASVEDISPVIVKPLAVSHKTARKKRVTQVDIPSAGISTSDVKVSRSQIRRSVSTGSAKKSTKKRELKSLPSINLPIQEEDAERNVYTKVEQEMDTISIDTVSSLASEEDSISQSGEITPDTLSLGDGDSLSHQSGYSRSRTPIFLTDEEVIPSLLQRLSASGVSAEDSPKDGSPVSQSPLGQSFDSSGSPQQSSQSPKMALLAVKDSLQSKLSSKTKSLMKTIRKKNPKEKSTIDQPFDQGSLNEEEAQSVNKPETENDLDMSRNNTNLPATDPLANISTTVDLTDLESVTTLTRRKLQDMRVLLQPSSLRSALLDWVTQLHSTLQQLHMKMEQERKVKVVAKSTRRRQPSEKGNKIKTESENKALNNQLDVRNDVSDSTFDSSLSDDADVERSGELANTVNESDSDRGCLENSSIKQHSDQSNSKTDKQEMVESSDVENNNDLSLGDEEISSRDNLEPINWTDVFHFRDPFHMSSQLHSHVEELCAICLDVGCHGNISKYIVSSSTSVNSVPNNQKFENSGYDESINSQCRNCLMCDSYCDSCDQQMALFVRCFFHFLSVDKLFGVLRKWKHNWFHTWKAAVKASQALGEGDPIQEKMTGRDYPGATDLLRSFILPNKQAFIGHVGRLFSVSSHRAVEFAAEVPKRVTMQDIINMCRLYNVKTDISLSKYIQHRLGEVPSYLRFQIVKELCTKEYLTLTLLASLLTTSDQTDDQGQAEPTPGSHMIKRPNQDLIDCVLDLCAEQNFKAALQTCREKRYWQGCLLLWQRKGTTSPWQQIISLIVKLGDITLLDDPHSYGYLPKTPEEWHYLLQEFSKLQPTTKESNWMNTLTWENIADLMVKTIGPRSAVMLLQDQNIPEGGLDPQFYQTCILESLLQSEQRLVVHNMLEKVDTYLWAQKQPHLAPQLLYAVSTEKRRQSLDDHQSYEDLFSRLSMNRSSAGRSVEDAETHWGIAADVTGKCLNCSLPLPETLSHLVPGVLIFTCGHSFHKFCVPAKACPLCQQEVKLNDQNHME